MLAVTTCTAIKQNISVSVDGLKQGIVVTASCKSTAQTARVAAPAKSMILQRPMIAASRRHTVFSGTPLWAAG
jgi:hypothetical protein